MGYPLDSGSPKALWFGRSIVASTLHPECIQGCQTPVWTRSDHEAAFGADQGSRTRHGHRRLGNVVLSASLSGSRQWPTTVCCGHLSQMDTPLRSKWGIHLTQVAPRRCGLVDPWTPAHCTQNASWGARRRSGRRQLGHEAAFRADQGLRTRHGHRRLGNVVLSASLSGGRQWPTTVCCGHLSQMDTPLRSILDRPFRVEPGPRGVSICLMPVSSPSPAGILSNAVHARVCSVKQLVSGDSG